MTQETHQPTSTPGNPPPSTTLAWLDGWMAEHPWHPRCAPFVFYIAVMAVGQGVQAISEDLFIWLHLPLYLFKCVGTLWLLYRYRRLTPELNFRFHWLAIPVGIIVLIAWIWLGLVISHWETFTQRGPVGFTQDWLAGLKSPGMAPLADPEAPSHFATFGTPLGWTIMISRLIGMAVVVPLFEELFIRSLLLRSFHHWRRTAVGFVHLALDMPVIGDILERTPLADKALRHERVFESEFNRIPLGLLSIFGVLFSTILFALNHAPRDYAGSIFCGIAYCLLLAVATRNGKNPHVGLGSVVWAHGITNALLWAYTIYTDDWQFL